MIRKLSQPKSIVFKWLLSYLLILIIPVLLFAIFMFRFVHVLDGEIAYSNSMLLEQFRLQMDDIVYDAREMCAEISLDPDTQMLADPSDPVSAFELSQIVENLNRRYIVKNSSFDFCVSYYQRNLVIDNSVYGDSQFYYDTYIKTQGVDYSQWNAIVSSKNTATTYTTLDYTDSAGGKAQKIVMIIPLSITKGSNPYANVVVMFDESELMDKQLGFEQLKRENILILNSDNKILYTNRVLPLTDKWKYAELSDEASTADHNLSTHDDIISYIGSKVANWKYIVMVPKKAYQSKITGIEDCMFVCLLLCFVFGGISIGMMLRRNYNPVNEIVQTAEKYLGFQTRKPSDINEFQYISNIIDEFQQEKMSTASMLENQKEQLRSQLLLRLIENKDLSAQPTVEELEQYDIRFQSDCFFILLYSIHDYSDLFIQPNDTLDNTEKFKLASLILRNVTEECLNDQQMQTYFFHTANMVGIIINLCAGDGAQAISIIAEQVEKARAFFEKNFKIGYTAACSEMKRSWTQLPDAYAQALKVLEYKETLDIDDLLFYQDIGKNAKENVLYYPMEAEVRIGNAIKAGDSEQAWAVIKEVLDLNLRNHLTPETVRYLMFIITGTIVKTINQMNIRMKTALPEISFHTIMQSGNVSAMAREIQQSVQSICRAIDQWLSQNSTSQGQDLYRKTVDFVAENYTDENLSVGMIAQQFDVHIVYLSRIFTENFGDSLSSYINKVRLQHAKGMIGSDQTLEAIAKAVGYCNLRTFMRVFKKYEGITPGKYRKLGMEDRA